LNKRISYVKVWLGRPAVKGWTGIEQSRVWVSPAALPSN